MFGRLFGREAPPAHAGIARPLAGPSQPEPRSAPIAHVQRDEILDARTRISGYRFRPVSLDGPAQPCSSAKIDALMADNLASFAQRRMAVVPLKGEEWSSGDYAQFVTPNTIFQVEVPPPGDDLGAWQDCLRTMKSAGARLGFDSVVTSSRLGDTLSLADAVFLNPADYPVDGMDRTIAWLRGRDEQFAIVVDDVHSWSDYRTYLGMGAHYCVGSFAATPDTEDKSDALPQSRVILLELLSMLRSDAETAQLAALAKRDPGVALKILEMTNSPLAGSSKAVASIDQALMMLGRDALYRWVAMSIFRAGPEHGRDVALLEIALRRARFMELIGQDRLPRKACEELFVLGLMSLMDQVLRMPMEQVLKKAPLPSSVADVLLRGEGDYAAYLRLALGLEKALPEAVSRQIDALGMQPDAVIQSNCAARAWAEQSLALN